MRSNQSQTARPKAIKVKGFDRRCAMLSANRYADRLVIPSIVARQIALEQHEGRIWFRYGSPTHRGTKKSNGNHSSRILRRKHRRASV